ncbi:MAG TPA: methyltransferase domain-containing protein [Candidatus Binatia bacterium]|nr:methyltransferase domain-containing protein [Candidatus Binatia bacterium]
MHSATVRKIIRAYDDPIVRAYGWVRFGILRQRFLDEIGQYLPAEGPVLDIGCGFGLFSLYYAATGPRRFVRGLDVNRRRIALARRAAGRLGLHNVAYEESDARDFKGDGEVSAAYMLDIVHHVEPACVPPLLRALRRALPVGGRLLVKDVDARPAPKRWFTWVLDKAMAPAMPVHYWSADRLAGALESAGFEVHRHLMVDWLPYPHVLYVCEARR